MRAFSALKAIARSHLVKDRIGAQVKAAFPAQGIGEQFFDTHPIAPEQVKNKALKVRGFGNIHGRAGRLNSVRAAAHTVDAGAQKLFQHIVFVGGNDQLVDRQPHHARHVASAHIAKISAGHREADLLFVVSGRLDVAGKVVHDLRQQARPVDGIDRANLEFTLELQIVRHGFNHVLTIIKHTIHGNVVDVLVH